MRLTVTPPLAWFDAEIPMTGYVDTSSGHAMAPILIRRRQGGARNLSENRGHGRRNRNRYIPAFGRIVMNLTLFAVGAKGAEDVLGAKVRFNTPLVKEHG